MSIYPVCLKDPFPAFSMFSIINAKRVDYAITNDLIETYWEWRGTSYCSAWGIAWSPLGIYRRLHPPASNETRRGRRLFGTWGHLAASSKPAAHKWVKSGMRKSRETFRVRQTCKHKEESTVILALMFWWGPFFIEVGNRRESSTYGSLKSPSVLRRWDFYF